MKLGQKLLVSIGTMFIFSETGSENEFPLAATPADKKLLKNNRYTFIFPNTGSENEFPLAATPADKKLISQQSDIFR